MKMRGARATSLLLFALAALVVFAAVVRAAPAKMGAKPTEAEEDFEGAGSSSSAKFYEIEGRLLAEEGSQLAASPARVILYGNGGQQEALATKDGSFHIKDVPPGAYLLEVVSNTWAYPKVRIDVSSRQSGKIKAKVASETHVGQALAYPLNLRPLGPMKFVEDRPGFHFLGLLKNPMVLMVGVTLLMTIFLPKLMTSDAMKELQTNQPQTNQPDPAQLLNKWLADGGKASKKKIAAPAAGGNAVTKK